MDSTEFIQSLNNNHNFNFEHLSDIGDNLLFYGTVTLALVSFLFNPIIFYIYSRPTFRGISASFYLRWLSVIDVLIMASFIIPFILWKTSINIIDENEFACKINKYIHYVLQCSSTWLEAFVSIDRLVCIYFVNRARLFRNRMFQWLIVIGIILIHLAQFYTLFRSLRIVDYFIFSKGCHHDYSVLLVKQIETSLWILPFIVMYVFTILIVKRLWESRKRLMQSRSQSATTGSSNQANALLSQHKSRETKDFLFAFQAITMNIIFFIIFYFICIYVFIAGSFNLFDLSEFYINIFFHSIHRILVQVLFSCKFFVYFIINSKFRAEFFILIKTIRNKIF